MAEKQVKKNNTSAQENEDMVSNGSDVALTDHAVLACFPTVEKSLKKVSSVKSRSTSTR